MQVIAVSETGQHSFELQDCARHMQSRIHQLIEQSNVLHTPASDSQASSAGAQQCAMGAANDDAKDGSSAADSAGSKRAQAKARQVSNAPYSML